MLTAHFPQVGSPLLGMLADLLTDARTAAGDLDTFLVLLTIMLRAYRAPGFAELDGERVLHGEVEIFPTLWTNVQSIADGTGIPKETVRRKVKDLVAAGLVTRSGNRLSFTPEAARRYGNVMVKLVRLTVAGHAAVKGATLRAEQ